MSLKCLDTSAKNNNNKTVLSALGLQPQLRDEVPNKLERGNAPGQDLGGAGSEVFAPALSSHGRLWDIKEPGGCFWSSEVGVRSPGDGHEVSTKPTSMVRIYWVVATQQLRVELCN